LSDFENSQNKREGGALIISKDVKVNSYTTVTQQISKTFLKIISPADAAVNLW